MTLFRPSRIVVILTVWISLTHAATAGETRLSLSGPSGEILEVRLDNDEAVGGIQFTLNGTGGIILRNIVFKGRLDGSGWSIISHNINDSTMNVLILRRGPASLPAGEGAIAEVTLGRGRSGGIFFSRVVVSSPDAAGLKVVLESIDWNSDVGEAFSMNQNYPNPFNPTTTIPYSLHRPGRVTLSVYDIAGREVFRIKEGTQPAGDYSAVWNSTDQSGRLASSGVYFVRLLVDNRQEVRKMILAR